MCQKCCTSSKYDFAHDPQLVAPTCARLVATELHLSQNTISSANGRGHSSPKYKLGGFHMTSDVYEANSPGTSAMSILSLLHYLEIGRSCKVIMKLPSLCCFWGYNKALRLLRCFQYYKADVIIKTIVFFVKKPAKEDFSGFFAKSLTNMLNFRKVPSEFCEVKCIVYEVLRI